MVRRRIAIGTEPIAEKTTQSESACSTGTTSGLLNRIPINGAIAMSAAAKRHARAEREPERRAQHPLVYLRHLHDVGGEAKVRQQIEEGKDCRGGCNSAEVLGTQQARQYCDCDEAQEASHPFLRCEPQHAGRRLPPDGIVGALIVRRGACPGFHVASLATARWMCRATFSTRRRVSRGRSAAQARRP